MSGVLSNSRMLEYELMKSYPNIFCFSTTRHGGCGVGTYASFNCTHYCGDNSEHVAANRRTLGTLFPEEPSALIIPVQTHGVKIQEIISLPVDESELEGVDAVMTSLPGCCLCVSTADCIPVLLYDTVRQVVAAIHAGWRGTVAGIVEKVLNAMSVRYGTEGKDVVACIGPGISMESYEVGDEVYELFASAGFDMQRIARKYDKWHIDLWEANRLQLLAQGVMARNIEVAGICTYKEYEHFFSARRLGIRSGRILTGILMRNLNAHRI